MAEEFTNTAEDMTVPDDAQAENTSQSGTPHKEQESGKADASPVIGPQAESFWENSVDASLINLSESEAPPIDAPGEQTASPVTAAEEEVREEHKPDAPVTEDHQEEPKAKAESQPDNAEVHLEKKAGPDEAGGEDDTKGDIKQEVDDREVVAVKETEKEDLSEEQATAQEKKTLKETDEEAGNREEEPDETPSDEEVSQHPAGFLKKKWAVYGCGAVLLVVIGMIVLFKSSFTSDNQPIRLTMPLENPEDLYAMKFFLPLDAGNDESRFVKATIAVAMTNQESKQAIDRKLKTVRKHIIDIILARSLKEMKSEKEINLLREEITARLNQCLLYDCIKETYFTELVVL